MTASREKKRAVVISDSELLFATLRWHLQEYLRIEVFAGIDWLPAGEEGQAAPDLIVVALSAPAGEPLVELTRTSLVPCLGRVPLLIISDRAFDSLPGEKIAHLGFPFAPVQLQDKISEILGE